MQLRWFLVAGVAVDLRNGEHGHGQRSRDGLDRLRNQGHFVSLVIAVLAAAQELKVVHDQ